MKKNILLALLSGSLLASAWVTYGFTALIFTALIPLLLMEARIRRDYRHTKRKVFALSYLAFLTWNIPTTWWIWYSTQIGAVFAILANTLLMTLTFFLYHIEISPHLGCFLALAQFRQRFLRASYVDTMVRIYGDFWRYTMGVDCEYHLIFSY